MLNFEFQNPTKILFGKGQIASINKEIPQDAKVLMTYGGGSIKTNGVYEQVIKALGERSVIEFGGIEPNPSYETLMKAVEIIKTENIDYVLAVGGGSVIDGTKFLVAAVAYDGEPWDILKKSIRTVKAMPFGTVLTLPATGSEMNSGAVITRYETHEKLSMGGPGTGSLLVFGFVGIVGFSFLRASAVAKIINVIADIFSLVFFVINGFVVYKLAIPMMICNIIGSYAGSKMAILKGNEFIRSFFLVVIFGLILRFGWDVLKMYL